MSRLGTLGAKLYNGEVSYDFVGRRKRWYIISGGILLLALVLIGEPQILQPLGRLSSWFSISELSARLIGFALLGFCALYTIGSWLQLPPLRFRSFELKYPRLNVVARQYVAAPLELIGAAGIIYFALPEQGNPGFFIVLGAFLLSFSAGLLSQVPLFLIGSG